MEKNRIMNSNKRNNTCKKNKYKLNSMRNRRNNNKNKMKSMKTTNSTTKMLSADSWKRISSAFNALNT